MIEQETERFFLDNAMAALLAAEARVASLEQDVRTYRELLQEALTRLHREQLQNSRLMWRIRNGR